MISPRLTVTKGRDVSRGLQLNSKGYIQVFVRDGTHVNPRTGETMSMVELAQALYYGTQYTPPRHFLEDAMREREARISALVKQSMVWRFQGLKATVQYEYAANDVAEEVRKFLREGSYYKANEPNSPVTIKEKGSDIPLIDTGQLVAHIEAEYVRTD